MTQRTNNKYYNKNLT